VGVALGPVAEGESQVGKKADMAGFSFQRWRGLYCGRERVEGRKRVPRDAYSYRSRENYAYVKRRAEGSVCSISVQNDAGRHAAAEINGRDTAIHAAAWCTRIYDTGQ